MQIDPDIVATIAVATAASSLVLLVAVVVLAMRLRRLRHTHEVALGDATGGDLVGAIATQARTITQLAADVRTVHGNTEALREVQRGTVSRIGLVRYDAFPDMGGMLSFSAALLDERGDGLVLSSINGRSETRSYGKPVVQGASSYTLTDEEHSAVGAALERRRERVLAVPGAGRRRA